MEKIEIIQGEEVLFDIQKLPDGKYSGRAFDEQGKAIIAYLLKEKGLNFGQILIKDKSSEEEVIVELRRLVEEELEGRLKGKIERVVIRDKVYFFYIQETPDGEYFGRMLLPGRGKAGPLITTTEVKVNESKPSELELKEEFIKRVEKYLDNQKESPIE